MKKWISILLMVPTLAFGALTTQPVSINTAGEPLFVVGRTIERTVGVKIVFQGVDQDKIITGNFVGKDGKSFLDQFAQKNGLVWAERDGQVIIAPAGTDLSPTLKPTARVSAPASFSKVLYDPKDPNKLGLMVFQIHNSWADDRTLGNKPVLGVARLFSQYVGIPVSLPRPQDAVVPQERAPRVQEQSRGGQAFQFMSLFRNGTPAQAPNAAPAAQEQAAPDIGFQTRGVYADGRLNAILVRDKVAFFESYKQIVALLDKPVDMVQLDALIIDLTKQQVLDFGINWTTSLAGQTASIGGAGASIILGAGAASKLLANIHATEKNGNSHTVSMPSAVTLNNVEATFSNTQNQFIKVEGNYDASLNKVTAETALRVTPLIANDNPEIAFHERRVKLLVNIQDGSFDKTLPNQPATTSQNQLTTQAVIRSGDMLVIGGHIVRRRADGSSGIPVLSKLPVIGGLFGVKLGDESEFVRVYMVRARILGEDSASANEILR